MAEKKARTARDRARAEIITEITTIARRQLAETGAAALSLRAVARELGMVSSAVYRYFPSRDDLLTRLVIDAYDAVGAAAEAADAAAPHDDPAARWLATCRAVRAWAVAHPHEYALIYGSPVPGYRAPADTVTSAARVGVVLVGIVRDAHAAGRLEPPPGVPMPPGLAADVERLRGELFDGVPPEVVPRAINAWTHLSGLLSFELFGHYNNVVTDCAEHFDHAMAEMGAHVGLRL